MGGRQTFLGIDLGSGGVKITLVADDGRVLASASRELVTSRPHPGWCEQAPDDWLVAMRAAARQLTASVDVGGIAAIGFSGGTHIAVLIDEAGRVLRPAILWSDQRSAREAAWLNERFEEQILRIGYQRAAATWTLAQLLWILRNEPEVARRCRRVVFAKDWLRTQVTGGEYLTDRVDAIGSLMLDAAAERWSPELCGMIGWPPSTLPPIVPSRTVIGGVAEEAARELGLRAGTPVVAGASDTAVEVLGAGALDDGQGVLKLATAGCVMVVSDRPRVHPRLINYLHAMPGKWYVMATTNSCASSHRWLRDLLFGRDPTQEAFSAMDELARSVPPGAEGLLFHPYLNGERSPYWDPLLRADFVGLTSRHDRAHLVRALYEGIAFSLRECLADVTSQGLVLREGRLIGGGSRSALWRQIMADVTGMELLRPETCDASFGAALFAAVGVGAFADEREVVRRCVRIASTSRPDPERRAFYDRLFDIYKDTQARLAEINHRLHALTT